MAAGGSVKVPGNKSGIRKAGNRAEDEADEYEVEDVDDDDDEDDEEEDAECPDGEYDAMSGCRRRGPELCTNKTIQIVIVVLVIIMAAW